MVSFLIIRWYCNQLYKSDSVYYLIYAEQDYETIDAEKDKHITELTFQLESLSKKSCIDSSHYDQFTLGKLIL